MGPRWGDLTRFVARGNGADLWRLSTTTGLPVPHQGFVFPRNTITGCNLRAMHLLESASAGRDIMHKKQMVDQSDGEEDEIVMRDLGYIADLATELERMTRKIGHADLAASLSAARLTANRAAGRPGRLSSITPAGPRSRKPHRHISRSGDQRQSARSTGWRSVEASRALARH